MKSYDIGSSPSSSPSETSPSPTHGASGSMQSNKRQTYSLSPSSLTQVQEQQSPASYAERTERITRGWVEFSVLKTMSCGEKLEGWGTLWSWMPNGGLFGHIYALEPLQRHDMVERRPHSTAVPSVNQSTAMSGVSSESRLDGELHLSYIAGQTWTSYMRSFS